MIMADEEEIMGWGQAAVEAVCAALDAKARAEARIGHWQAYLREAGGIMGDEAGPETLPLSRVTQAFQPDFLPRPDEPFEGQWNFVFPPHAEALMDGVPADQE